MSRVYNHRNRQIFSHKRKIIQPNLREHLKAAIHCVDNFFEVKPCEFTAEESPNQLRISAAFRNCGSDFFRCAVIRHEVVHFLQDILFRKEAVSEIENGEYHGRSFLAAAEILTKKLKPSKPIFCIRNLGNDQIEYFDDDKKHYGPQERLKIKLKRLKL